MWCHPDTDKLICMISYALLLSLMLNVENAQKYTGTYLKISHVFVWYNSVQYLNNYEQMMIINEYKSLITI